MTDGGLDDALRSARSRRDGKRSAQERRDADRREEKREAHARLDAAAKTFVEHAKELGIDPTATERYRWVTDRTGLFRTKERTHADLDDPGALSWCIRSQVVGSEGAYAEETWLVLTDGSFELRRNGWLSDEDEQQHTFHEVEQVVEAMAEFLAAHE